MKPRSINFCLLLNLFIGHAVEEIRVRALQSITFKLNHDLLCVADIVHKKELFVKLLEWFNFEPCSMQKDVLQLLEKLSKVVNIIGNSV